MNQIFKWTLAFTVLLTGFCVEASAPSGCGGSWSIKSAVRQPAKSDPNAERTKLGLREEVDLFIRPASTPNAGQAIWRVKQGNGFCNPDQGVSTTYTAHHDVDQVTIEAKIGQETQTISFTVVKPTGVKGINPPAKHRAGSPVKTVLQSVTDLDIDIEIEPTDVSFYRVRFGEKVGTKSGTGDFGMNGWAQAQIPTHEPSEMDYFPANNTAKDHA